MQGTEYIFNMLSPQEQDRPPNSSIGKINPQELETIRSFVWSDRPTDSGSTIKIQLKNNAIRLLNSEGKLLAVKKKIDKIQHKILVSKRSHYNRIIAQVLVGEEFILTPQSIYPDFDEYHHYLVPEGYKLQYTEVMQLWKIWWNKKRKHLNDAILKLDVLVYTRNHWHSIQDFRPKEGNFAISTTVGEVFVPGEQRVVWLEKLDSQLPTPEELPQAQFIPPVPVVAAPSESGIPTETISRLQPHPPDVSNTVTVTLNNDRELEDYLSTFDTSDTEDVADINGIYQIDRLVDTQILAEIDRAVAAQMAHQPSPERKPPPPPQIQPKPKTNDSENFQTTQLRLKSKALKILSNYLTEGEMVESIATISNSRGEIETQTKTIIRKNCPRWAIEQIRSL
jgi:hypothetical protein